MLEERYGRWASHVALLSLLTILAVGAGNLLWADAATPLWRFVVMAVTYFRGNPVRFTPQDIFNVFRAIISAAIGALIYAILVRFLYRRWHNRAISLRQDMCTIHAELKQEHTQVKEMYSAILSLVARAKIHVEVAEKRECDARAILEEALKIISTDKTPD